MSINELNEKREALLFSLENPQYKKFHAKFREELATIDAQIAALSGDKNKNSRSRNYTDKRGKSTRSKQIKSDFDSVRFEGGKNPNNSRDKKAKATTAKKSGGATAPKKDSTLTKPATFRKIGAKGSSAAKRAAAQKATEKAAKTAKGKTPKTQKNPKTVKEKPEYAGNYVENIDTEKKLLGRVLKLEGKTANKAQLETILRAFALAKTNDLITKKSVHYGLVKKVYEFLHDTHEGLSRSNSVTPKFAFKADTLAELQSVVNQNAVFPSIMVLRRYVGFQGKAPAAKATNAWFHAAEKIKSTDKYHAKVQEAIRIVSLYDNHKSATVAISQRALDGLSGLLGK